MNKAVFFDRDGTLIEEKNYLNNIEDIKIFDDAFEALSQLKKNGYKLIIVSNQSGVARGYFSIDTVKKINDEILKQFQLKGVNIDGVYFCPHHRDGSVAEYSIDCECRKPKIKLALEAKNDFNLDLSQCIMVGDKESDIEFGINFKAKATVIVNTGYGSKVKDSSADFRANSLIEACKKICMI